MPIRPKDTSDRMDLALLKAARRVLRLLCEIVDVHRQAQLCLCGDFRGPPTGGAQLFVAGIFEEINDESGLIENREHLFGEIGKFSAGCVAHGSGK